MGGRYEAATLLEDSDIKDKVIEVWSKVFEASNRVLKHANNFGFSLMEIVPSPNIHEMLAALQIFSSVLDILINHADKLGIEYEETRLMLNAREQLTRMERVAFALKANNKEDFDLSLAALEKQAAF
ncbi:MAG: hypothetical protein ACYCY8_00450 [Burkholderiales bacterium]